MIVVKVGGSLFDLPDLGPRLRRFLAGLTDPCWLLVSGGSDIADVIRSLDQRHGLGPQRSHWLALRACTLNAHFLHELLPMATVVTDPRECNRPGILDSYAFVRQDEGRPGALPHHWQATSDSVAARVAEVSNAPLVLLKSVTIAPNLSWEEAAAQGYVDEVFPELIRRAQLAVRAVNFRSILE